MGIFGGSLFLNLLKTFNFNRPFTDYTSARAAKLNNLDATVTSRPTLVQIEGSTVLAKQAKLDFVEKWILDKLVESPSGTWRLYDDDGVTIVKSWKWDAKTRTRELSL